jgi:hypothetical protein
MKAVILAIAIGLSLPDTMAAANDGSMSHPGFSRGRRVHITGRVRADGTIDARRIRLRDPDSGLKIEGRVTAIDSERQRMRLGGFEVSTAADPLVYVGDAPASLSDVAVGQIVEARGYWSYRLLHASRVRVRTSDISPEPAGQPETRIEAQIERVDRYSDILIVLGRTVRLTPRGRIIDERTRYDPLDWTGRRLRRDEDDRPTSPIRLGDWFAMGGGIGGELRGERNFDGESQEQGRRDRAAASTDILASLVLARHVELYARARATREFEVEEDRSLRRIRDQRRVVEAAFSVDRIAGAPVGFQIGRQRFSDVRAWFMDTYLDAATVHVTLPAWRFEVAVANAILAGPETERSRRDQRHLIGSVARRLGRRASVTAIVVARDDRNRDEQPVWLGGSLFGRPRDLTYWANAAVRRGQAGTIALEGWAVDGAMAYRFRLPGRPMVAAGFATASGDNSRSDGVDSTFRQTSLEGNSARFHGLKRFAYYGEVFDPELSNMEILTGGTGMRPFGGASIDVVYHRYRQRLVRTSVASNALAAIGTGTSADLGEEVDVILSVQRFRPLDFSVVAGIFWPGAGMASPIRPARYWRPQIRLVF